MILNTPYLIINILCFLKMNLQTRLSKKPTEPHSSIRLNLGRILQYRPVWNLKFQWSPLTCNKSSPSNSITANSLSDISHYGVINSTVTTTLNVTFSFVINVLCEKSTKIYTMFIHLYHGGCKRSKMYICKRIHFFGLCSIAISVCRGKYFYCNRQRQKLQKIANNINVWLPGVRSFDHSSYARTVISRCSASHEQYKTAHQ